MWVTGGPKFRDFAALSGELSRHGEKWPRSGFAAPARAQHLDEGRH